MTEPDIYEDDGENIYLSMSASGTATASPDDDGLAGVREPFDPPDLPPSLTAEAGSHEG